MYIPLLFLNSYEITKIPKWGNSKRWKNPRKEKRRLEKDYIHIYTDWSNEVAPPLGEATFHAVSSLCVNVLEWTSTPSRINTERNEIYIYIYKKREGRLKTLKEGTHCGTWTLSWTGLGATVEEFLWWLSHVCHVPSPAVSPPCPRNSTPRRRFSRSRILSALLLEKRTENEIKNHPLLLFPLLRVPISSSFKDGRRTNWFFVIEFFFIFRIIQFF